MGEANSVRICCSRPCVCSVTTVRSLKSIFDLDFKSGTAHIYPLTYIEEETECLMLAFLSYVTYLLRHLSLPEFTSFTSGNKVLHLTRQQVALNVSWVNHHHVQLV